MKIFSRLIQRRSTMTRSAWLPLSHAQRPPCMPITGIWCWAVGPDIPPSKHQHILENSQNLTSPIVIIRNTKREICTLNGSLIRVGVSMCWNLSKAGPERPLFSAGFGRHRQCTALVHNLPRRVESQFWSLSQESEQKGSALSHIVGCWPVGYNFTPPSLSCPTGSQPVVEAGTSSGAHRHLPRRRRVPGSAIDNHATVLWRKKIPGRRAAEGVGQLLFPSPPRRCWRGRKVLALALQGEVKQLQTVTRKSR